MQSKKGQVRLTQRRMQMQISRLMWLLLVVVFAGVFSPQVTAQQVDPFTEIIAELNAGFDDLFGPNGLIARFNFVAAKIQQAIQGLSALPPPNPPPITRLSFQLFNVKLKFRLYANKKRKREMAWKLSEFLYK